MGRYNKEHGFEADCDVIYGDTDSVMVNFKVADIGRAMELGREAADFVSQTFVKPIKLEFEKVCNGTGIAAVHGRLQGLGSITSKS